MRRFSISQFGFANQTPIKCDAVGSRFAVKRSCTRLKPSDWMRTELKQRARALKPATWCGSVRAGCVCTKYPPGAGIHHSFIISIARRAACTRTASPAHCKPHHSALPARRRSGKTSAGDRRRYTRNIHRPAYNTFEYTEQRAPCTAISATR